MAVSPQEVIERFIGLLSSRARYGLRGEKPIAIIAALGYCLKNGLTGIGLLELVENQRHSGIIKSKFIQLASRYGEISNPSSSWSVITGSNRELQRVVAKQPDVDEAFAKLNQDQLSILYSSFMEKLKRGVMETPGAHVWSYQHYGVPRVKYIKKNDVRAGSTSDHYAVLGPRDVGKVEVWSVERLPFEPKGWLKQLRHDICETVKAFEGHPNQVLHAIYISDVDEESDAENILFYNVGASCFAQLTLTGLRFERVFSRPPVPPRPMSKPPQHYHRYELVAKEKGFTYWAPGPTLATWNGLSVEPLSAYTKATSIWYSMKSRSDQILARPTHVPSRFGLRVVIHAQRGVGLNLAAVIKPVFDGVVAAFHRHDGTMEAEVSRRLARVLNVDKREVDDLLRNGSVAVLGTRRLLWPWSAAVQWNPADNRCVAGELLLQESNARRLWELSGELFEAKETTEKPKVL